MKAATLFFVLVAALFLEANGVDTTCITGYSLCGAQCVNLMQDVKHCGKCFSPCNGGGRVCSSGSCSCEGSLTTCNVGGVAECVDTMKDQNHCGACGNSIGAEQYCEAGTGRNRTLCTGTKKICGHPPQCVEATECVNGDFKGSQKPITLASNTFVTAADSARASHIINNVNPNDEFFIRGVPGYRPKSSLEVQAYRLKVLGLPNGSTMKVWICQDKRTSAECKAEAIDPTRGGALLDAFNNEIEVRSSNPTEFHIVVKFDPYDSSETTRNPQRFYFGKRDLEEAQMTIGQVTLQHSVGLVAARRGITVVNTNMRNMVTMA